MASAADNRAAAGRGRGAASNGRAAGGVDIAVGEAQRAVLRAQHAASEARQAAKTEAQRDSQVRELFAQPVHTYLHQVLGRPAAILRAGCQTPVEELGLEKLRANGFEISVTTVDAGGCGTGPADPGTAPPAPADAAIRGKQFLGDLRTVPLPPRSFDIVVCAFLLERIPHASLVLDRFVAALRPGGLLLLRVRDRDCAAAALDRILPNLARKAVWTRLHPTEPGPFPAIYDPLASAQGIQAYALAHGLVITRRETACTLSGAGGWLSGAVSAARVLIAGLSRGRLTDAHDELLFVIRKPEDRFARLL